MMSDDSAAPSRSSHSRASSSASPSTPTITTNNQNHNNKQSHQTHNAISGKPYRLPSRILQACHHRFTNSPFPIVTSPSHALLTPFRLCPDTCAQEEHTNTAENAFVIPRPSAATRCEKQEVHESEVPTAGSVKPWQLFFVIVAQCSCMIPAATAARSAVPWE